MPTIQLIKRINEKTPSWVRQMFAPVIRKQLIDNRIFTEQYNLLVKADKFSEDEIANLQKERLRELIIFAYENTIYYRKIMDAENIDPNDDAFSNLKKLPILTKEDLKRNLKKISSESIINFYKVICGGVCTS